MNENFRVRTLVRLAIGFVILPILAACSASSGDDQSASGSQGSTVNGVRATLSSDKASRTSEESVDVTVTLTNESAAPVQLLKWHTLAAGLTEPLFTLTHDGEAVNWQYRHYKYGTPRASDYVVLAPGESLTRTVDLSQYYDMSAPGAYDIQYRSDLTSEALDNGNEGAAVLESNRVSLRAESHVSPLARRTALVAEGGTLQTEAVLAGTTTFAGCSSSQQTDTTNGFSSASTYANQAVTYLNGTPSATARYTTWFGTYSTSNWNVIKGHFTNIKSAYDTKNFKFDCSCADDYYAYVYPDSPYTVYLCNAFWTAPRTGTDSKAGTIIHETSHFTVVAGTDDHTYGQSSCKSLAKSNPANARDNADSHEYFAENTPAQN